MRRRLFLVLAVLLILATAAAAVQAGPLTAGSYTYVMQGRELAVPVDILSIQGAYLVPPELLRILDLTPQLSGDTVTLKRGPVAAVLQLGQDTAVIGGDRRLLDTAPVLLAGRVLVPAAVLPYLGFELEVDDNFVLLRDYVTNQEFLNLPRQEPDFEEIRGRRTARGVIYGTSGAYSYVDMTALTPELLQDERLEMDWGTRVRLLSLLPSRTLFLVTMRNVSQRTMSLDPAQLLVTDDQGRQYDYLTEIPVNGLVTAVVAPGAVRTSVLAYEYSNVTLTIFSEANGSDLGRVLVP